jgi:hypothetical protein
MEEKVAWSARAEKSMARILSYLRETVSDDYADEYLTYVDGILASVSTHPTKGMIVNPRRNIRRWKLDRHNYATYIIRKDGGILIHNIFDYARNKKGFHR